MKIYSIIYIVIFSFLIQEVSYGQCWKDVTQEIDIPTDLEYWDVLREFSIIPAIAYADPNNDGKLTIHLNNIKYENMSNGALIADPTLYRFVANGESIYFVAYADDVNNSLTVEYFFDNEWSTLGQSEFQEILPQSHAALTFHNNKLYIIYTQPDGRVDSRVLEMGNWIFTNSELYWFHESASDLNLISWFGDLYAIFRNTTTNTTEFYKFDVDDGLFFDDMPDLDYSTGGELHIANEGDNLFISFVDEDGLLQVVRADQTTHDVVTNNLIAQVDFSKHQHSIRNVTLPEPRIAYRNPATSEVVLVEFANGVWNELPPSPIPNVYAKELIYEQDQIFYLDTANGNLQSIFYDFSGEELEVSIDASHSGIGCDISTVTLTADVNGASDVTYQWSTGETTETINISEPGEYAVTVTDMNDSCPGVDNIIIETLDMVDAVIDTPEGTAITCAQESVILDATGSSDIRVFTYQPNESQLDIYSREEDGAYISKFSSEELSGLPRNSEIASSENGKRVVFVAPDGVSTGNDKIQVLEYSGGIWSQIGDDILVDIPTLSEEGYAIDMSNDGSRFIIGSPDGLGDGGAFTVFEKVGENWQKAGSSVFGESTNDRFGAAVSISADGRILAVGIPGVGEVKMYSQNEDFEWVQLGQTIEAISANDGTGTDVAMPNRGDLVAIGSPNHNENTGAVRSFIFNNSQWVQDGNVMEPQESGGMFGASVDYSGDDRTIIGGSPNASKAYIFRLSSSNEPWKQLGSAINSIESGDETGFDVDVAFDGKQIIVGSPGFDGNKGAARIFRYYEDWIQIGSTINGSTIEDRIGVSVDIADNMSLTPTYLWSTGSTNSEISISEAGEYAVTVSLENGCSETKTITVTEEIIPVNPIISATPSPTITCDATQITLSAAADNDTGQLTFLWSTGETTRDIVITEPGTYTLSVRDGATECQEETSILIGQDIVNPMVDIGTPNGTTLNDANPSLILDASQSSGSSTLSFLWSTGSTDPMITVSSGGSFMVTVTGDANGCTSVVSVIVLDERCKSEIQGNTILDCNNSTTTLTAIETAGIDPDNTTYLWSTGSTNQMIDINVAGDYSVTITVGGSTSCVATASTTVTGNTVSPILELDLDPSNILDCEVTTINISAAGSTGQGTVSYLWSTGSTQDAIDVSTEGDYGVTITDSSNGCTSEDIIDIFSTVIIVDPQIDAPQGDVINCNVEILTISATVDNDDDGVFTYLWNTGETTSSITVDASGQYTVVVQDPNSKCIGSNSITISENTTPPTATITTPDGTILSGVNQSLEINASTSTGQGTLDYLWSTGSTNDNIIVIDPGTFSVTITDLTNGCTDVASVVITDDPCQAIIDGEAELNCNNESIILTVREGGGTPTDDLDILWSTGSTSAAITVSEAGQYSVTINTTGGFMCTSTATIDISDNKIDPTTLLDTPMGTVLNMANPTLLLDASNSSGNGALSYEWSTGENSTFITIDAGGTYMVTVTDVENGCFSTESILIMDERCEVVINGENQLDCTTASTTLTATEQSGADPATVQYLWNTGSTDSSIFVTDPGTYSVTITVAGSCTDEASFTVSINNDAPIAQVSATPGTKLDCEVSSITLDASDSSSTGNLSYLWSTGAATEMIDIDQAGTYSLTITDDANNCTDVASIDITDTNIEISLSSNSPLCEGQTLLLSSSVAGDDMAWTGPNGYASIEQNPMIADVTMVNAGIYTFSISLDNGCVYSDQILVEVSAQVPIDIKGMTDFCQGSTIVLMAEAGEEDSYSWTGPNGFMSDDREIMIDNAQVDNAGIYRLTVVTASGCTLLGEIEVFVIEGVDVELVSTGTVCDAMDVILEDIVGEGDMYTWQGPGGYVATGNPVVVPANVVSGGSYTVTVTSSEGCITTADIEIENGVAGEEIISKFLTASNACVGDSIRFIDFSSIEGIENASFSWNFGNGDTSTERDPIYSFISSGVYTVSLQIIGGDCPGLSVQKDVEILDCRVAGSLTADLNIFPNPTTSDFNINLELPYESSALLEVYDQNGSKVWTEFLGTGTVWNRKLTMEGTGIYTVRITHDLGVISNRILIIK